MRLQLRILLLILCITAINYFDRSAISFAVRIFEEDLRFSSEQFGYVAAMWGIGYLLMVFFIGLLVDRFGSIRVWAISAALWSLVTLFMGFADRFETFLLLRLLLGMAESGNFPCLTKTVADWMPAHQRGRCISFGLLGVPLASVIGAPFLTTLLETIGRAGMFLVLGLLGFFWTLVWLVFFRGKKNPHLASTKVASLPTLRDLKTFFSTPALLINCFIFSFFGYVLFFGLIWFPDYFEKVHGISIETTGFLVVLPWAFASAMMLAAGWLSDFLMKRGCSLRQARSFLIGSGMLLSGICFALIPSTLSLELNLLFLSLGLGFVFLANPPIYALIADLCPKTVGTAQAIHTFFFALAGSISPAWTGVLIQKTGSFEGAIYFVSAIALLGALLAFFFQHPHPIEQKNKF